MSERQPLVLPAGSPHTTRETMAILRAGGVAAVPTDTVYGLIARYDSPEAVERIYEIKGRPPLKPLPLLLASSAAVPLVATDVGPRAWKLINRFWPGPLTIVLRRRHTVPDCVTGGLDTVGVRMPNLQVTIDVLRALGIPVASTSANLSGEREALSAEEVLAQIPRGIDVIVSANDTGAAGTPSTVVDLTRDPPTVLRLGGVGVAELSTALGTTVAGPE